MLGRRLRRRPNIKTTLVHCIVYAVLSVWVYRHATLAWVSIRYLHCQYRDRRSI